MSRNTPSLLFALGITLGSQTVFSATLSLSDTPLYLGSTASPNILFVMDDSGSMDWEVMTRDFGNGGRFTGTQPDGSNPAGSGTVKHRDGDFDGTANCGFGSGSFYGYFYGVEFASNTYSDDGNDCNTADDQAWRFRNSDFNPLYFDPTKTYQPWAGVDSAGNAFTDMPVTAALADPYDPSSETIDLTLHTSNYLGSGLREAGVGFRYYTWTDSDGDGLFDDGEETEFLVSAQSAVVQQNFANWFSYYRSREFVAKASYGRVIANAGTVRMGLVTLHNNNSVNIAVADMNSDPASGAKRALLDSLYSFHSNGGTPLRDTYYNCGKYLECTSNDFFTSCPASSAADGGNCQQNFMVVMTDGFYNGSFNISNFNEDGDNNTSWDGGAYADSREDTLGDIAMYFYERDLQTGLANDVPIMMGVDEADHQHAVTYTVAFGVDGTLTAMPADPAVAFSWPNPGSGDAEKIDDLRHAAYNGRGLFLSAQNPQELESSLLNALSDIGDRTSSAASVALNSGALNSGSQLFQARFDSGDWSGQLLAYGVQSDGSVGGLNWDAGNVLESNNWNSGRNILSYNSATSAGIPFRWASLSAAQQAELNDDPTTTAVDDDGEGADRLDYLRGDRSNEGAGNMYRIRNRVLGDIIHSNPTFFGPTTLFLYPDNMEASSYYSYLATRNAYTPVVYAGSNDGQLHAFNANNGQELFAYVPSSVYGDLNELTKPQYQHKYFVDGEITVVDAYVGGAWKSILVGGMRSGGQGYFALDVSNPSTVTEASAASKVLWEYTDADDADLGYSFGKASIVKLNSGEWAAVFGNGYNNTEADGNASTSGDAALYIVNLASGALIRKISTLDGTAEDPRGTARPNGLNAPALIDVNNDAIVDVAYAGDLFGNLWKFDLTDSNSANWKIAHGPTLNPSPLFSTQITMASGTHEQPITVQPQVDHHPTGSGYLVFFGTGQYMETGDNSVTGTDAQTFYAIWDDLSSNPSISRSDLLQQRILSEPVITATDGETESVRITTDNTANWSSHKGWYMDLYNTNEGANTVEDNGGERAISNPLLRSGRIIFTTLIPSTEVCGYGGTGWLMELNADNGARLDEPVFDIDHDGTFDSGDYYATSDVWSFSDLDLDGDGYISQEEYAEIPGAPDFSTVDTDGDGRISLTEYQSLSGGGITKLIAVSGKKSKEGLIPQPTVLSDDDIEYKYTAGSTGAIEVTNENPDILFGRQSWRRLQ